jgi:hypothetical protein
MSKSEIYLINQNTKAVALGAVVPLRAILDCDHGITAEEKRTSESPTND